MQVGELLKNQTAMKKALTIICLLVLSMPEVLSQKVTPLAYYTDKDGIFQQGTTIEDGQAPLAVHFQANPSDLGEWTPTYEWHLRQTKTADNTKITIEVFMRNDEDTDFTFMESGVYTMTLRTILKKPDDMVELDPETITITIAESKLEFPNAFSPNDDGINDIYRAKPDYKSIISFKAIILNRWGQKLYEWNDPAGGWDGTFHGSQVKQGVYFVYVEAKGADGKEYKIKKDVNLLRGYVDNGKTTGNE